MSLITRLSSDSESLLTHALELCRQQTDSDMAFACDTQAGVIQGQDHALWVGLSPELARTMDLRLWSADPGSLPEYLLGPAIRGQVMRPIEAVGRSAVARGALFRRIERFRPVGDALAASLDLGRPATLGLILLRWSNRPAYGSADARLLTSVVPLLTERLTRMRSPTTRRILSMPKTDDTSSTIEQINDRLSRTEQKVLTYLQRSMTEKEIAAELQRSPHTVHVHVKSIYLKLGVSSRRELMSRLTA